MVVMVVVTKEVVVEEEMGRRRRVYYYLLWIRWFLIGPISSRFDDFDGVFQYCEWVEGMGEKEVKKLVRNIIFLILLPFVEFQGEDKS